MHRHLTARDKGRHSYAAGAKRVLVSAPADGADLTVVYGDQPRQADQGSSRRLQRLLHHQLPLPFARLTSDTIGIEKT